MTAMPSHEPVTSRAGSARLQHAVLLSIAGAALLVFAWNGYSRTLNIPFHDDILDVLAVVLQCDAAATSRDFWKILFAQYNDHRTMASRLVYWLAFLVQGEVDFRTLALLANLAIPALLLLYGLTVSQQRYKAFALTATALLLLQPRAYEFLYWPMSAFAFYFVCVYAFASLYMLEKLTPWRLALAGVFGVASNFSLSSGQLIWVVGAVCIVGKLYRGEREAGRYLIVWLLLAVAALAAFHSGFNNPNSLSRLAGFLLATPMHQLQYFFALLGSGGSFGSVTVAIGLGAGLFLLLMGFSIDALRRERGALFYFAWFLVLSSAAVALGRAPYSDVDYALTPRYSVASLNFIIAMLLQGINRFALLEGRGRYALVAMSMVFWVASYVIYVDDLDEFLRGRVNEFNSGHYPAYGYSVEFSDHIVNTAIQRGIYHPPTRPLILHNGRLQRASAE